MARKKSAEELALEAELAAGAGSKRNEGSGKAEGDTALPEAGKPPRKEQRKEHHLPAKLGFLSTAKGKLITAGVAVAIVAIALVASLLISWNATDKWDGTQDTSWYDPEDAKTSYTLTTAEQLAGLGQLVEEGNLMDGVTIKLGCNLDMYDIPMKPIASGRTIDGVTYNFAGNFDGQGHTITGLNVEEDTWDYCGLFGAVRGEYIKDLTVEGKIVGEVTVGGIAGSANGTSIINCTNRCQVSAMRTATSDYPVTANCGGIVGLWMAASTQNGTSFELTNLVNEGVVSARAASVGGVVGYLASSNGVSIEVSKLTNRGSVELFCESEERDEAAGGVIGLVGSYGDSNSFDKLSNEGEVSCSSVLSVGGVFGSFMLPQETCSVTNCTNSGRVAANASAERGHVGGIFGYIDDPANEYEGCSNSGELAATNGNADDICATGGRGVWDAWDIAHPKSYY